MALAHLSLVALVALLGLQISSCARIAANLIAEPTLELQAVEVSHLSSRPPETYSHPVVSEGVFDVYGDMTVGFEQEWYKKPQNREGVKLTSEVSKLKDHTRVAHTQYFNLSFETQGNGPKYNGALELISEPFVLSNRLMKSQLESALAQAQGLQETLESMRGAKKTSARWYSLARVAATYHKTRIPGELVADHPDLQVRVPPKESIVRSPQITVTHHLLTVHAIFQQGWPIKADHMHPKGDVAFRTAMMTSSAAAADAICTKLFPTFSAELMAGIKGFLTLQAQVMFVTSMKVERRESAGGAIVFPGEEKPYLRGDGWYKDYYGLIMKTPLGAVFRHGLSKCEQKLIRAKLAGVKQELRSILIDALKRRGFEDASGKLDVGCPSKDISIDSGKCYDPEDSDASHDYTVDEYHERSMTSNKKTPEKAARLSRRCDETLRQAVGNNTKAIRQEKGARPAFEYRQLSGKGPGDHLTNHLNVIIGSAVQASKPLM